MQSTLGEINSKLHHLGGYAHHIVGHLVGFVVLVGLVALGTMIVRFEPSIEGAYEWVFGHHDGQQKPAIERASPDAEHK